MRLPPSALAKRIVSQHPARRFMSERDALLLARRLDACCVTSMTPNPLRLIPWRPAVRITRHYLFIGAVRVRMTGLTGSEQYAALWSATGDWRKASKLQAQFNRQFTPLKRASAWTPNAIIR